MVDVSIIIPVYNGAKFIKECIDSILQQNTKYSYEVLICDDGSIDNTYGIITSYETNKIKIFKKQHTNITDALNILLDNAQGEYIMRMDADDIMFPTRIDYQVDFMKKNQDIDLLGGGRIFMKDNRKEGNCGYINIEHFVRGNVIIHPAIIFKSSLNVRYENDYPYAEDMYLYYKLLLDKKTLYCDPEPVIMFRDTEPKNLEIVKKQIESGTKITELFKNLIEKNCNLRYPLNTKLNDKSGELTCVITFKNEGIEVRKTIESIRNTCPLAPIVLVNDASDDGYDYESILCDFDNIKMRTNTSSVGVGPARNIGVSMVETEYFVILDGHMRFWHKHWDTMLIQAIMEHPRSIVTSNTVIMRKDENGVIQNEDGSDYNIKLATGAIINENEPIYELTSKWAPYREGEFLEIASIMGAVYASTTYWWKYIRGTEGLKNYGNDESLIAIKTWLLGGKCYVLNNWGVGHIYRIGHPYTVQSHLFVYNKILMVELFMTDKKRKKEIYENYKKNLAPEDYDNVMTELYKEQDWIQEMKNYIRDRQVISFDQYLEINRQYV